MDRESLKADEADAGLFATLERFERELSPPADTGFKRDRWWVLTTAVGMLLAFTAFTGLFGETLRAWLSLAGVGMQLVGLMVISYRQARDIVPDFIDSRRKYADELDQHFAAREEILAWLRSLPASTRHARLRYVESRLETMRSRYALAFGVVEKLGFLPVLAGVYVQVQAQQSVSLLTMTLGVFIAALYAMSLWIMGYRLQLESYARLMRAAEDGQS